MFLTLWNHLSNAGWLRPVMRHMIARVRVKLHVLCVHCLTSDSKLKAIQVYIYSHFLFLQCFYEHFFLPCELMCLHVESFRSILCVCYRWTKTWEAVAWTRNTGGAQLGPLIPTALASQGTAAFYLVSSRGGKNTITGIEITKTIKLASNSQLGWCFRY